ncbi:MAG: hypothetical protein ACYC61_13000 [Isosphaeraceae bacterium]
MIQGIGVCDVGLVPMEDRMRRIVGVCMLVSLGALFVNRGAIAGNITVYSDRSAFDSAMNVPLNVETFTNHPCYPITTGTLNSNTDFKGANGGVIKPGDILAGVTYSTPIPAAPDNTYNFFNIDSSTFYYNGQFLDSSIGGGPTGNNANVALTTTFDHSVAGFGFDTSPFMGTNLTISITFKSGPDYTNNSLSINTSGLTFFGFVSSATDIVSATMYGNDQFHSFAIYNFTFPVSAASVPEPSSIVGASLAVLIGAAGTWRRRALRSR